MKLENQVTSLELSQKLKELGVKQESLYYYREWRKADPSCEEHPFSNMVIFPEKLCEGMFCPTCGKEMKKQGGFNLGSTRSLDFPEARIYSAFTVAELGEMLPKGCFTTKTESEEFPWRCEYKGGYGITASGADTEADARAKMLIYPIENKLITI